MQSNCRPTTISVEGYDTWLHQYPLKLALRKHFASCGKIARIIVPRDYKRGILKSPLFIDFWGEGARDKALELSGSDVGGWNVVVKAVPRLQEDYHDPAGFNRLHGKRELVVKVYDLPSSVRKIDVQIGLCEHFSSCGEVTCVTVLVHGIFVHQRKTIISIMGEGCVEKAQQLSGRNAQGWKIVVDSVIPLSADKRKPTGCEHPSVVLERIKKAKMVGRPSYWQR
ncbi:unnamed protein product [Arabidopsis halleri]